MQVNVSRRECEMQLDNKDFDERAQNYRRKKWIENGEDPDEMEKKWADTQKAKQKQRKKAHREYLSKKRAAEGDEGGSKPLNQDERFQNINTEKFFKKKGDKSKNVQGLNSNATNSRDLLKLSGKSKAIKNLKNNKKSNVMVK